MRIPTGCGTTQGAFFRYVQGVSRSGAGAVSRPRPASSCASDTPIDLTALEDEQLEARNPDRLAGPEAHFDGFLGPACPSGWADADDASYEVLIQATRVAGTALAVMQDRTTESGAFYSTRSGPDSGGECSSTALLLATLHDLSFALHQVAPNPVRNSLALGSTGRGPADVKARIFEPSGRRSASSVDRRVAAAARALECGRSNDDGHRLRAVLLRPLVVQGKVARGTLTLVR